MRNMKLNKYIYFDIYTQSLVEIRLRWAFQQSPFLQNGILHTAPELSSWQALATFPVPTSPPFSSGVDRGSAKGFRLAI